MKRISLFLRSIFSFFWDNSRDISPFLRVCAVGGVCAIVAYGVTRAFLWLYAGPVVVSTWLMLRSLFLLQVGFVAYFFAIPSAIVVFARIALWAQKARKGNISWKF